MQTFKDHFISSIDENTQSDLAKSFMKEFNKQVSLLKQDMNTAQSNNDWMNRLQTIRNLINKTLDN
jgi:hypothetical protein